MADHRPAAFLPRSDLARELSMSESTVDEMVRRGVLPRPRRLSTGCVRWCWEDVLAALASLKEAPDSGGADPFLAGVSNVTEIKARRRGPA